MSEKPATAGNISAVMRLMKRMGATRFTPLPPLQHQWYRSPEVPILFRMWGWLVDHTVGLAVQEIYTDYAMDTAGHALFLEDCIAALAISEAEGRVTWRLGVEMTLWRDPDYKREEPSRRLYIRGDVDIEKVRSCLQKKALGQKVESLYRLASPRILLEIKKRPPEIRSPLLREVASLTAAHNQAHAEALAVLRVASEQVLDPILREAGIDPKRQDHRKQDEPPEEIEARQARQAPLLPALTDLLQTIRTSLQTGQNGVYTEAPEVGTAALSLFPENPLENLRNSAAGGRNLTDSRGPETPPVEGRESPNLQPAGAEPRAAATKPKTVREQATAMRQGDASDTPATRPAKPEPLDEAGQAALRSVFSKMRDLQEKAPNTRFADPLIDPADKGDMTWAREMLALIGPAAVEDFFAWAGDKMGLVSRSLGKEPSPRRRSAAHDPERRPNWRFFGLIRDWAEVDWPRDRPSREQQLRVDREAKQRRDQMIERQRQEEAREEAEWQRAELEWAGLPAPERQRLIALEAAGLKADRTYMRLSAPGRAEAAEHRAKQSLRDRMRGEKGEAN